MTSLSLDKWFFQHTHSYHFPRPNHCFWKDLQNDLWKHVSLWIFISYYFWFKLRTFLLISIQTTQMIILKYAHAYLVSSIFGRRNYFFWKISCLLFIYLRSACWRYASSQKVSTSEIMFNRKFASRCCERQCLKSCSYTLWWQLVPYCFITFFICSNKSKNKKN